MPDPTSRFRTVIVGGGIAGVEAALALHDLAGDAIDVTLVAPEPELLYRPMVVREPFSYASARRYPLARIARDTGAELVEGSLGWVDRDQRVLHTEQGRALPYDALVLAIGARRRDPFEHVTVLDDRRLDDIYHGVVQDIEEGYLRGLALVIPSEGGWPLPVYELALMTAERAYSMNVVVDITVITPERTPLAAFGTEASSAVASLLQERGIAVECHARARVPRAQELVIEPGDRRLRADRIVSLPELYGPAVRGVPAGDHGFLAIDQHCRVRGTEGIYAAGDATDYPIKHGGLSTQQADVAAADIARLAGLPIEAPPLRAHIEGMLLTGRAPLYLSAQVVAGTGLRSAVSETPLWSPATKVASRYLSPYLEALDRERTQAG